MYFSAKSWFFKIYMIYPHWPNTIRWPITVWFTLHTHTHTHTHTQIYRYRYIVHWLQCCVSAIYELRYVVCLSVRMEEFESR